LRRSRRFSGCVSPSPSGVDRSEDGQDDGPVVRLDDTEFRRNGNVRTEAASTEPSPDLTLVQIYKGQRVKDAFDRVLDDPRAAEALQHPAPKPLLDEAAG
jgi:hypothetical protein